MSCHADLTTTLTFNNFELKEEVVPSPDSGYVLIKVETAILHPDTHVYEGIGIVLDSGVAS